MTSWVMRMRWLDLLFAHWPVAPDALLPLLPAGLELDVHDGRAWLGIVPFTMADVAPRGLPAVPHLSRFPEINVRTYVRHRGSPGVYFLSLDCASSLTVWGSRRFFHLPYFRAEMSSRWNGDEVDYRSNRADRRGRPVAIETRYRPTGPVEVAAPGSFEAWSTDRMCLFATDRRGRIWRTRIEHGPWPLQPARADFATNTMALAAGIPLPDGAPHLRFASRLDVHGFPPERVG